MKFLCANALGLAVVVTACAVEDPADGNAEDEQTSAVLTSGPTVLSNSTPMGLFISGGVLYWTSRDAEDSGPEFVTVWSCGPNNIPGLESIVQESEFFPDSSSFNEYDNITGASVGGALSLFFVYNYSDDGFPGTYILQMSSAGGARQVIGASNYVAGNDLKTDGTNVFWSDSQFVWRVPVGGGGTIATVVQTSSAVVGLDSTFVYYADGPVIRRVRKTGGARETIFTAANPITALYVTAPASGPTGTVYWGEQGGAIRSVPAFGGTATTYQDSSSGRTATAVGFDGSRVLWIDCQTDRTQCAVRKSEAGVTTTVSTGIDRAGHLQWDDTRMYWGQTGHLMQFVH